jgi:hypothetical protein
MLRYKLRTLLLLMAVGPPLLGYGYVRWQKHVERERFIRALIQSMAESERQRRAWFDSMALAPSMVGPIPSDGWDNHHAQEELFMSFWTIPPSDSELSE